MVGDLPIVPEEALPELQYEDQTAGPSSNKPPTELSSSQEFRREDQKMVGSPGRGKFRLPDQYDGESDDLKVKLLPESSVEVVELRESSTCTEVTNESKAEVNPDMPVKTAAAAAPVTNKNLLKSAVIHDLNELPDLEYEQENTGRRRKRQPSFETTELTEVLTIYEKLKKGRENGVYRHSRFDAPTARVGTEFNQADETISIVPIFNIPAEPNPNTLLDFNKYQNLKLSKYLYFSKDTNLLQSDALEELSSSYRELLSAQNFWLNIFDPNEQDFSTLFNAYGVHDLTLNDIKEGNTEDKVEVFKHYTFLSLRLIQDNTKDLTETEDIDFNILLFKDFIITMHDKQWTGNADILGFLNLLISHSGTPLIPDWVMFSCFVEMNQDAKDQIEKIEPVINRIRIDTKGMEMSDIMRRIFELELQVYSIGRFVKPKARVLRHLKVKCRKRINHVVMNLLNGKYDEFREQTQDLCNFNHILERSQDTFLAIVSADQSREANEMSLVMKRISEFALVFLPIQAISGFLGMNVTVPFQTGGIDFSNTQIPFWIIVGFCVLLGIAMYFLRTRILASKILNNVCGNERCNTP